MAPEQTGKSLAWQIGLLWSFIFKPCLSLVCYPSDDLAEEVNNNKLQPLMKEIPQLAAELAKPRSKKIDSYEFSNLISYFMGAGSRVTSHPAQIRVADELDDWVSHENQVSNVQDMRKRARQFLTSIFYKVCSPTLGNGPINQEFRDGSRGFWNLRCLECGKLTMPSHAIYNLQWELDDNEEVIEESIRLICPICRHEHKEKDKRECNLQGDYIHERPGMLKTKPSFQWGLLASQLKATNWLYIAHQQMKVKKNDIKSQLLFDNSVRGLPKKNRKFDGDAEEEIKKHIAPMPAPEILEAVFMSVDTQDSCFYYRIRGIDKDNNTYPLTSKIRAENFKDLDSIWETEYLGIKPMLGIIDEGGNRPKEVQKWVKDKVGWFTYKGDTRTKYKKDKNWKRSKTSKKLILGHALKLQADLLYYMYTQNNKDAGNYWYLHENETEEYYSQLADMQKSNRKKDGDMFINWAGTGKDHCFDCEKQMLLLIDYAKSTFKDTDWLQGKVDWSKKKKKKIIQRPRSGKYKTNNY